MDIIQEIVQLEWSQFQEVQNEGGPADCQRDWRTFQIMRESYFMPWRWPTCISYRQDLKKAKQEEWNLVFEKYARMTVTKEPGRYSELAAILPDITLEKSKCVQKIVKFLQMELDRFTCNYPNLIKRGRVLSVQEEMGKQVSVETYLRCELMTYSERTLKLLVEQQELWSQTEPWMQQVYGHMVKRYGFETLDEAEKFFLKIMGKSGNLLNKQML